MKIILSKREKVVRLQYIKAFREKLDILEEDFQPWAKHRKRRLRNVLKQMADGRQTILRNGKLF